MILKNRKMSVKLYCTIEYIYIYEGDSVDVGNFSVREI